MKESDKAATEAAEIITRDILKLAPGVQSGTATNLVNAIVRAAVARVAESTAPQSSGAPAENNDPSPAARFDHQRAKLGLPRKDRK